MKADDPHADARVATAGRALADAATAVVLLHGRGGEPSDMLSLAVRFFDDGTTAFLAPQAAGQTWYPHSFLAAREQNEPSLSGALRAVGRTVDLAAAAVGAERVAVVGFSQGACLAAEFVARHPKRYGGLVCLTGGLIGATLEPAYAGHLAGTPALLTSGDPDPHVPWPRVEETAVVLRDLGAGVDLRRYPGRPHTISADEVELARGLLAAISGAA